MNLDEIPGALVPGTGLAQLDWDVLREWIKQREDDERPSEIWKRAAVSAWLDRLQLLLPPTSMRWRSASIEGLGLRDKPANKRLMAACERSISEISNALGDIRGSSQLQPVAVIALSSIELYYDFVAHFYEDEGEYATSGGIFIGGMRGAFPLFVINAKTTAGLERTVGHELTHHALADRNLPLWVEEGLAEMMAERVSGETCFHIDHETMKRHRGFWAEHGFEDFISGLSFSVPEEQEFSYHLAEMMVRSLLTARRDDFMAFSRACKHISAEAAARKHLGDSVESYASHLIG